MNDETPNNITQHEGSADADILNETLAAENSSLRDEINAGRIRYARLVIGHALESSGARSPALLSRTVEGELQFSDAGDLLNADAIVANLKRTMPEQFADTQNEHAAGIDGGARGSQTTLTREILAQMPPERIAELDWDTVKSVLSGN